MHITGSYSAEGYYTEFLDWSKMTPMDITLTGNDIEDAVNLAKDVAAKGDIVLLSPACASFDAFRDFEDRGDTFCRIVQAFVDNRLPKENQPK